MWFPTPSAEVLKTALPPTNVAVSITVLPSLKVTVPVGVESPVLMPLTVAVKVTFSPKVEGSVEELKLMCVQAGVTVWVMLHST